MAFPISSTDGIDSTKRSRTLTLDGVHCQVINSPTLTILFGAEAVRAGRAFPSAFITVPTPRDRRTVHYLIEDIVHYLIKDIVR